jgi:hypothetical protein
MRHHARERCGSSIKCTVTVIQSELISYGGLLLYVANLFWFRVAMNATLGLAAVAVLAVLISISLGSDVSKSIIDRSKTDASLLTTILHKDSSTTTGLLVMSGERGLLVFDPQNDRMIFERLEDLKSLQWPR